MSADAMDYYDVAALIRDARSEVRGEIDDRVRAASIAIREDYDAAINELREQIASLDREFNARTELV